MMDDVTREIKGGISWCMIFAGNVVLVDDSRMGVNKKLELWRQTLDSKCFRLSRTRTEHMCCDFSDTGQVLPFWYLGSNLSRDGNIDEDVRHRIETRIEMVPRFYHPP